MTYNDSDRWHLAASITRCSRGVYLVWVDVGDEVEPHEIYWATGTPRAARAWARKKAHGPLHWRDHNLNPDELVFGYCLRKNYLARLPVEEDAAVVAAAEELAVTT